MTHAGSPVLPSRNSRSLAELTAGIFDLPADIKVSDVTLDSRKASPGALFLACRGRTQHGLAFARQAVERGARAVLFEITDSSEPAPRFESEVFVAGVEQLSRHVGTIADRFFGAPSQALAVAGITGTNGKTTCAYLLAQALEFGGRPAAYIGTIGYGLPGALEASDYTTADAVSVHRQLAALRELGSECVAMEVSSHALDQGRVDGVRFHTAVFTNLTRDHLDYHGTLEAYGAAKARLFAWPGLACRVVNVRDDFGARLAAQSLSGRLVVTSSDARTVNERLRMLPGAQYVCAMRVQAVSSGLELDVESSWGAIRLTVPLVGEFNADNVLTVLAVLLAWGMSLEAAADALARCKAPSGRMEAFGGTDSQPLAIVDYAHTPDALAKALRAARAHCRGRLWVVFGCGGDRDAGKRPEMGRIAAQLADEIVLTDDNPRSESPQAIVAAIRAGIDDAARVRIEHDRARAIRAALGAMSAEDVLLVAGKGHEDYQIYGVERRPFSDQRVVRACMEETR